jgi:prevent-host-death family protein
MDHSDLMPNVEISAAKAKARFAECLKAAERGEALVITRHGRRVAAIVPAAELEQLRRLRAAGPRAGLAGLAGGWKGSEEIVDAVRRIRRTRGRGSGARS